MGLACLHISPWTWAAGAHLQSMGQDDLVLKERSGLDTWGFVSCCAVAWGSADGLEKLEMKNDSNQPEASTGQIKQNNTLHQVPWKTGFCPWLG